jgi:hypothetical protein
MVGGPFFALATVSPTLQRWLSETGHPRASNPYFLYAASNAGSLLALVAYPLVAEPLWSVTTHVRWWSGGYVLLVMLVAAAGWATRGGPRTAVPATLFTPGNGGASRRWFWVYAAAVPSALMLGVTRHLATDVASFPLLWVIPLALYLVTFIIAFSGRSTFSSAAAVRLLAIPLLLSIVAITLSWRLLSVVLPLAFFTSVGLLAHGRLYASRPDPAHLTEFYLWVAVGGAGGGVLAALAAPLLFQSIAEYPLAIVMALWLLPHSGAQQETRHRRVLYVVFALGVAAAAWSQVAGSFRSSIVLMGATGILAFATVKSSRAYALVLTGLFALTGLQHQDTIVAERTFYGVYRVYSEGSDYVMTSGTTVHGAQRRLGNDHGVPIHYYYPDGPAGRVLSGLASPDGLDVGVIGLGTGALAAYAGPADHYTFYEIDQAVVDLARDTRLFTYLEEAAGEIDIAIGDGRLEIGKAAGASYNIIVLDAFSSDAIPVHLLTTEAFDLYRRKLKPDGVLLVHISNRYLDLEPIVGRIADELAMDARIDRFEPTAAQRADGAAASVWVIVGSGRLPVVGWDEVRRNGPLWTDSFTSILSVFRWD